MKAEINIENKARFFALYWGQNVIKDVNNSSELCTYPVHPSNMYRFEESHLELTPLSDITDDDAIEVTAMIFYTIGKTQLILSKDGIINMFDSGWNVSATKMIRIFDYLRSKGYALPFMGLSVEDMVQAGWIKLIEDGKLNR